MDGHSSRKVGPDRPTGPHVAPSQAGGDPGPMPERGTFVPAGGTGLSQPLNRRATGSRKMMVSHPEERPMPEPRDTRVDAWLDALPEWQRRTLSRVRELVHEADPEVQETIKRTVQPYFVLDGNVCAFLAAKDHVNVFVYDGAIVPDPHGIITAGHDNETARTVGFREGDAINEPALVAMFRQIIANNRAGGWRKLKAGRRS
jgi:hypothetical protein